MDLGWKRAHLLLFFLTFWKHAVGQEGLALESVDPRSLSFHKTYSPQGVQSSLNALVTGNIPLEEVDSNVLEGNGTSPSRSRFSNLQFVKGGAPSSYAPMSQAQSASSGSVSKSLTVPQNLSQPGSSSLPGSVSSQSSFSQSAPGSFSALSYSPTFLSQSGSKSLNTSSQSSSGTHIGGVSPGSQTSGTALSQRRNSPQTAPAPSKPLSSGLPSQVSPGLLHSSACMASPALCQYNIAAKNVDSLSQHQPLQRLQPSVSLSSPSIQTSSSVPLRSSALFDVKTLSSFSPSSAGGPSPLVYTQGAGSYSGSRFTPGSSVYSKLVSSPLGAPSQFPSAQSSHDLSTSSLQSSAGTAQTVSRHYTSAQKGSTSTFSSSFQPQVGSSQYGPAPSLNAEALVYSQSPPAGTIYHSQPSRLWQPSISKGTGSFSTSGAAMLQSSSSSQSVQAPSSSSSAGTASYPVSTKGSGSYSDLSHYPGTLLQYTPVAPASVLFGSSPLSVASQSTSGQSSPSQYTSLFQSRTGSLLTSRGYLSAPGGSGSSGGSSLLAQGTFGKYTPVASMDTRMPVFSQTKGVSLSQSQPLQSSTIRWLDVPAYGAALQSGSSQSPQTSGSTSFLPASSTPVDSVAQSGQTSVAQQTPSLLGLVSRPARPLYMASSGSVSNQLSPVLSALLKQPTGSMTPGSTSQAALRGMSSAPSQALGVTYGASVGGQGMSSGLKSVLFSSYSSSSQSGSVPYSQASGSVGSKVSPGLSASLKQPTGSMTPGSTAQGVSVSSQAQTPSDSGVGRQGMSSGLKSVLYSSYGSSSQSGPVSYGQSAGGPSSPSQYTSLSQSRTGSLLTSSGYLSAPGGSGSSGGSSGGSSLLAQGTFGKYTPVASMDTRMPVFSQTKRVSSGVSLSQSQPLQSSTIRWLDVQASGAALPSGSSQSAPTSISFLPASSTPVDYLSQSGQTSVSQQSPSLLGFGSRPARLLSIASSGSVSNQLSPVLSALLKQPTGSMTPGSTSQAALRGMSSAPSQALGVTYGASVGGQGMSSGLKSVLYSSYGSSTQSGPVSYSPVSGSAGSKVSPGLFTSLKQPTVSITPGSTAAQPASGGMSSAPSQALGDYGANVGGQGMSDSVSSGLTVSSSYVSSYDQMNPVSKPSRASFRQYYAVKG